MVSGGKCIYTAQLTVTYPWLEEDKSDKHKIFCKICKSSVTIAGGLSKIDRHANCDSHKKKAALNEPSSSGLRQPRIGEHMPTAKNQEASDTLVAKAEAIHTFKLALQNCSFRYSDIESASNQTYSFQFPDSAIAKKTKIGRTKSVYILNSLAAASDEMFHSVVTKAPFFGIHLDESTKLNKSKLEYYLTYIDVETNLRRTEFLDSLEITLDRDIILNALKSKDVNEISKAVEQTYAGADHLKQKAEMILQKHNLRGERLLYIMSDNCHTMQGKDGGFAVKMQQDYKNMVKVDGCGAHHLNTAVQRITKGPLEEFYGSIKALITFLHTIGKVTMSLSIMDDILAFKKLPREAPTRFLYLMKILDSFREKFVIIKMFVEATRSRQKKNLPDQKKKYPDLIAFVRNPETPVLLDQFATTLEPFRIAMKTLQAKDATILSQRECLLTLVKSCLSKIGLGSEVNHAKSLIQFYQRSQTTLQFQPRSYEGKIMPDFSPLWIKSKDLGDFYAALSDTQARRVTSKIMKARELLLAALLSEMTNFASSIFTRHADLMVKPVSEVKQSHLNAISNEVPSTDAPKLIEELIEASSRSGETLNEIITSSPGDKFPQLKTLKTVLTLIQPHNMEVERGFSITTDILTLKRNRMTHDVYRNLRSVKRLVKSIDDIKLVIETESKWNVVHSHMKTAHVAFVKECERKKQENSNKKRAADELRSGLGLPEIGMTPAEKERKRQKLEKEMNKAMELCSTIQKQKDDLNK